MNKQLLRAVSTALAAASPWVAAIDLPEKNMLSTAGKTSVEDAVAVYAWSAIDSTRDTPTVFNANSKNLGWAHNTEWYDIAVAKTGNYRISVQRINASGKQTLHPAFSLWPVHAEFPFDPQTCSGEKICGDASNGGTHSYNQVAAPSLTNSSAWMLGPNGPDVNPDGEAMHNTLKWTPRPGYGHVTGFIGYANSGTGGPGPDAWKTGLPLDKTGGRYGAATYFSFGNDQDDVLQGGFVNTAAAGGLGGSTLDKRSNVDAPLGGGYAAMNLYNLAAGHYLLAVGGSCIKGDCGAGTGSYRLEVTEITGAPQAIVTAKSPVRAGASVTLDGGSSLTADGGKPSNYLWTQTAGPSVTLSPGGNNAQQSFTAPGESIGQALSFSLKVDDGKLRSDPATVSIVVSSDNTAPTVKAASQSVLEGALVNITPTVTDNDGDGIATYRWEQTGGPTVLLSDPNGKDVSFTAPFVGSGPEPLALSFALTVTDDYGFNPKSTTLSVPVNVSRDPQRLDCSRATASAASLWPPKQQFRTIAIKGVHSPNNAPYSLIVSAVTQDEPIKNKAGKDGTGPDAKIQRGKATRKKPRTDSVLLRAERQTTGDGRMYSINFQADDGSQTCTGVVKVEVPLAPGQTAVDGGQNFDATKPR
jgi:hypothetical protein